ncbi:MAG: molybdopterin-dependent oxidoreductase [Gaiellaceae bacterium]
MSTTRGDASTRRAAGASRPAPLFRVRDLLPRSEQGAKRALPPGQRAIGSFPRYGTHFARRDPAIPARPRIVLTGPGIAAEVYAESLEELPRVEIVADFHCVAGWTARDVHWEGVRFRDVYETFVVPGRDAGAAINYIRAVGRDGFRAVLALEDALADDVLIADRLHGAPLPPGHGAPFRLLSVSQYGYKSVKWLERVEFHTKQPSDRHRRLHMAVAIKAVAPHPRARVWHEERHRLLPARSVRFLYLRVIHVIAYLLGHLGGRLSRRG